MDEENRIPLRNKKHEIIDYVIVSKEDYDSLNKFKWSKNKGGYATGKINGKCWRMHRYIYIEILGNDIPSSIHVDHIDRNKLNNSRDNLRHDDKNYLQYRNKTKLKNATSKYYGVSFFKNVNKWNAQFSFNNRKEKSFYYDNELHAAWHYNLLAKQYENETGIKVNYNDIEEPEDFILYVKKDKKNNLPRGINISGKKYRVVYKHKHIGNYKTLEEAQNAYNKAVEEDKELKLKEIKSKPILRNKEDQCIIEIFNRKKEKVSETIVDEDIYYDLLQYNMHLSHGYVKIEINSKYYGLNRYIMNCYDINKYVDHVSSNILDNRKENLRIVLPVENSMNKSKKENTSSKYIGVTLDKNTKKWKSQICINTKTIYLGYFENEEDAAKARDEATIKYFGEFGKLNFDLNTKKII